MLTSCSSTIDLIFEALTDSSRTDFDVIKVRGGAGRVCGDGFGCGRGGIGSVGTGWIEVQGTWRTFSEPAVFYLGLLSGSIALFPSIRQWLPFVSPQVPLFLNKTILNHPDPEKATGVDILHAGAKGYVVAVPLSMASFPGPMADLDKILKKRYALHVDRQGVRSTSPHLHIIAPPRPISIALLHLAPSPYQRPPRPHRTDPPLQIERWDRCSTRDPFLQCARE